MDLTIMGIFIVIAFVAGAYVRKPWTINIPQKKHGPRVMDVKTEEKKLDKVTQLENILSYTGTRASEGKQ